MRKNVSFQVASVLALSFAIPFAQDGHAAECSVSAPDAWGMTADQIVALYDCISADMEAGYVAEGNPVAQSYRSWVVTGIRPGPDTSHGDRLLFTFANDVAAETYLAFDDDGVEVPVGGILAKESISVKDGQGSAGPLFIMEKSGIDVAPDTGGWVYSALQPTGSPMKISQSFCHDCHTGFEAQDSLAYPAEELRVGK